jgi:hypothetical protein
VEQISRENPETPTNTIRGSEWNLDAVKPKTISKPSRGVFKPKNVVGDVNVGIEATDQIVGADQIVSIPPEAVSFKTYTARVQFTHSHRVLFLLRFHQDRQSRRRSKSGVRKTICRYNATVP